MARRSERAPRRDLAAEEAATAALAPMVAGADEFLPADPDAVAVIPGQPALPYKVVVDFLEGTTKKKDAMVFAHGFIEQHFRTRDICWYTVAKYESGFVFEIHEGGPGRSFIKNALDAISRDPQVVCVVPMARRLLEIKRGSGGAFSAVLLPERMEASGIRQHVCKAGPAMISVGARGGGMLTFGAGVLGLGAFAFLLSLLVFLAEPSTPFVSSLAEFPPQVPAQQWETIARTDQPLSTWVEKVTFENGRWTVSRVPIPTLEEERAQQRQALDDQFVPDPAELEREIEEVIRLEGGALPVDDEPGLEGETTDAAPGGATPPAGAPDDAMPSGGAGARPGSPTAATAGLPRSRPGPRRPLRQQRPAVRRRQRRMARQP